MAQVLGHPKGWARALELVEQANADGLQVKGQVIGRPTGILLGLDLSYNPFSLHPAYRELAHLPLAERVAMLRRPDVKARILADGPGESKLKLLDYLRSFTRMYRLGEVPNYAPEERDSVAGIAAERGISPEEAAYDLLLERDGRALLFVAIGNYVDGNLDVVEAMVRHPDTMLGLGDGGAHYGVICDAGYPTFMLSYWARDRHERRLPLEAVVHAMTDVPARFVGLADRGRLAVGYKADLNVIDPGTVQLSAPYPVYDLPANGRRLVQSAQGYRATIVSGVVTRRDGNPTGMLPGRLVRGRQSPHRQGWKY